jgi:hypothetical protein
MKRIFLTLTILVAGASAFCAFHYSAARIRNDAADGRDAWLAQTQLLARTQIQRTELTTRIRELKQDLFSRSGGGTPDSELARLIATNGMMHLSPEQRERLLAELGFDWNSTGDYLVVSKDSLRKVTLNATHNNRLTDAACQVLALTPEERAGVESAMSRAAADYKTWATSHIQRTEPEGDVVAKYTLQTDADVSQSFSNTFCSGVMTALGSERGELLLDYAGSWMMDMGLEPAGRPRSPTTMIVRRQSGDQTGLGYELRQAGSTMSTVVSPWQPFPGAFLPLFPGGWPDLAAREGFELPKEFKKDRKTSNVEH